MKNQITLTTAQKISLSRFQVEVYQACMKIPAGKVATYKAIGQAINCKSSQAVGQALRRNPYNGAVPSVPCHDSYFCCCFTEVVKTDLSVGGFTGSYDNADKKQKRLQEEGIEFFLEDNGVVRVDEKFVLWEL